MALTASAPVVTARGDQLNKSDGFVSKFEVVKPEKSAEDASSTREDKVSESTLIIVGNSEEIPLDTDTGFVGMSSVLKYIELVCSSDSASLKKCVASWYRKPASLAISASLLRRDRGASQFVRGEGSSTDVFVHPAQLLSNIEVGVSTRTWLVSTAAFAMSYHQITRAYLQSPADFERIEEHVEALQARVNVLSNGHCMRKLMDSATASVKAPYADFNYSSVAQDAVSRLSLLARADLAVLKYIRKHPRRFKQVEDSESESAVSTPNITVEQLRFLKDVAAANGDLWFERSVHTYDLGDQCGAVVVFPSGHLHCIVGGPGTTSRHLLKKRTSLARMDSLVPYIPYELSGYSGDITKLALVAAQLRKGAPSKAYAKVDLETAKNAISTYAVNLTTAMIVDPLMLELLRRAERKASQSVSEVSHPPVKAPKSAPAKMKEPEPEEDEEEDDEEDEDEDEEKTLTA